MSDQVPHMRDGSEFQSPSPSPSKALRASLMDAMRLQQLTAVDAGPLRNVRGEQLAVEFAVLITLTVLPNGQELFTVPSATTPGVTYSVLFENGKWVCFCADYLDRRENCKHVAGVIKRFFPDLAPVVTDALRAAERLHPVYVDVRRLPHVPIQYATGFAESTRKDHALMRQPIRVRDMLVDLSKALNRDHAKPAVRGGQPMPPGDLVLSMVLRAHMKLSLRKFWSVMRDLSTAGFISGTRSKTSLVKYQNSLETTRLLMDAYRMVIRPLRYLETTFIIDGTGLSPMYVSNYLDMKHGNGDYRPGTEWLTLHTMIGQKSKAIIGFTLTPCFGTKNGEVNQFDGLMDWIVDNGFANREYVVADNLYLDTKRIASAKAHRMQLVCPLKGKNFTVAGDVRAYARNVADFAAAYPDAHDWLTRARSAIEGVFSVIKRSDNHIAATGTVVERANAKLAGLYTSRLNEMLCRVIAQVLSRYNEIELLTGEKIGFEFEQNFSRKFMSEVPWESGNAR